MKIKLNTMFMLKSKPFICLVILVFFIFLCHLMACKKDSNKNSNGRKYNVRIEYELTSNISQDKWMLKDHGTYTVTINGNSGTVTEISNPDAIVDKVSGSCTSLIYGGTGPINIHAIDFNLVQAGGGYVYVSFNDNRTVQLPKFNVFTACTGSTPGTIDMGISPAIAGSVQFTDNGKAQTIDGSAGGVKLITTVTPTQ